MSDQKELIIDSKCGHIVRQIRMELHCTQAEFGRKLGVSQPVICQIERREVLPTESLLQKLARIAGVSLYQMTGQEPISYAAIW